MITFKPVLRKNPKQPDDPKKYYPMVKSTGVVNVRTISDELSDASTLNIVDIRAVLFGLEKALLKYLQEGYTVKFGDVGTFRPSMSGTAAEKNGRIDRLPREQGENRIRALTDFETYGRYGAAEKNSGYIRPAPRIELNDL